MTKISLTNSQGFVRPTTRCMCVVKDWFASLLSCPLFFTNASITFENLMNKVFKDKFDKFVIVFIDDTLIYSKSEEKHEQHIEIVLQRLKKKNCMQSSRSVNFG